MSPSPRHDAHAYAARQWTHPALPASAPTNSAPAVTENKARVPTPVIDTSLPNNFPATVASTMSP